MSEAPKISDADRREIDNLLHRLDHIEKRVTAALKPLEDLIEPVRAIAEEIEEQRASILETHGVEVAGRCEVCTKLLFIGDLGSAPYDDATEIIFCAEHGMSFEDVRRYWMEENANAEGDDEDQAESRKVSLAMVAAHLAGGGALADLVPPRPLL